MNIRILVLLLSLFISILQAQETKKLVILYTNDTHSRLDPIPETASKNADEGGIIRRDAYIEQIRKENPNVLVLQAGDIVQGAPYYNLFFGKADMDMMNFIGYDASCLGNHEFDLGLKGVNDLIKWTGFPFIATNYSFSGTFLKGKTREYLVVKKKGLKIGIIGIGVDPEGLIAKNNYAGMKFLDPVTTANATAAFLKGKKKCDMVICLSHLGYYENQPTKFGDIELAQNTRNIDIIIGGHSHTFLPDPVRKNNLDGREVVITQMGKDGVYVGRLDILFSEKK
ncbi:MAG: metallophosphatase [Candidatus Azobacteroides sp.]|nr:metallophosphatase [Candidatus Azobacteroides sp.]